jgi:chemotaxis signal transduction protein
MTLGSFGGTLSSAAMHVVSRVGDARFAFRVADVEEAVDAPALLPVPNAGEGLAGQLAHRGRTVSAFDAAWAFGVPRSGHATTALVLRVADDRVAVMVDDVEDLASIDADAVRPVPSGTDPDGLLHGVCLPRTGGSGSLIGVVNAVAIVARASLHGAGAPQ